MDGSSAEGVRPGNRRAHGHGAGGGASACECASRPAARGRRSWLGEALFAFGEDAGAAGEAVLSRLVLGTNTAHVMASVLAVSGETGQRLLTKALDPDHPEACLVAALIKIEAESDSAVKAIGPLTANESSDVREEALLRLSESGPRGRTQLPGIHKALKDEVESVREAAVQAAAGVAAEGDADTADALAELLLQETDGAVMRAAIAALEELGARTPTVRRSLEYAAGQAEEDVASESAAALQKLFPD